MYVVEDCSALGCYFVAFMRVGELQSFYSAQESCFCIHVVHLCLLVGALNLFTVTVIINIDILTILLFCIYLYRFFFSFLLLSCCDLIHVISVVFGLHFLF